MKEYMTADINWEIEMEYSSLNKRGGRGTFTLLDNRHLILACNQENDVNFHREGKLVRITDGKIADIFGTKYRLWAPVVDGYGDIYIATSGYFHVGIDRSDPSILFKIGPDKSVIWEYQLEGGAYSLPVIYQDSIFIYDFIESEKIGGLYRLNRNGDLLWKKNFDDAIWYEPFILEDRGWIVVGFNFQKTMMILDLDGNVKQETEIGVGAGSPIVFSRSDKGNIYACINSTLMALGENMELLWTYKPAEGFVTIAPVISSTDRLYSLLSGKRMISLDSSGNLRWIAETTGVVGYQPYILEDGNILVATSEYNGKKPGEEEMSTYLEIFSDEGKRLLKYELQGTIFHYTTIINDTVFAATNCSRIILGEERQKRSFRVYSLRLS